MELGSFSISLVVKDLAVSKDFYEKLGFTIFGGVQTQNCLILKNGAHTIGFFKECLKIISSLLFLDGMGWDGMLTQKKSTALRMYGKSRDS